MPLRPNFIERQIIKAGLVPGPLLDLGIGSFTTAAFIGAGQVDLFRKMNEGPAALSELAHKTGTKERALENLLNALEPLGYVERKNGQYMLTKYAKKTVPIDTFHEMTPFFKEQTLRNIKGTKKALREASEEGVIGYDAVRGGEFGKSYQVSMRWLASGTVKEVTKKLKLPKGATRMLDIGGSHGLYCVEMCRKHSQLKATVLDWPIGIENAKETLEQETDVADRIDTVEGDFIKGELPRGYDLAFLGNIIHGFSPEENKDLFQKIADSTTEKGTIGILDQFDNLSGSKFTRSVASLIGWNLFLFANGRAYDVEEVKGWLKEAGFPYSKVKPLKQSPGFTLLEAKKQK